jgi:excisionase family DNA binding protein
MPRGRNGEYYTVSEAADELGVSPSTVWRWIQDAKLTAYRVGPKAIRIKRKDVAASVVPARPKRKEVSQVRQSARSLSDIDRPLSTKEANALAAAIEQARLLRRRLLKRRKGRPLPSSWRIISEAREERSRQL